MPLSRSDEVTWGRTRERAVAEDWLRLAERDFLLVPSPIDYSDFDFSLADPRTGLTVGYLEVKNRRCSVDRYTSTLWPARKVALARQIDRPFWGVMRFTDALVEVDLTETPSWRGMVARDDRPPVEHVAIGYGQSRTWRF